MRTRAHFPRRASHSRPRPVVLIGRGSGCDVVIDDWTVSRRHARIRRDGGLWILEDLDSANGTSVNGEPVLAPVALRDGDVLTFGIVAMRFSDAAERHLV